MTRTTVEEIKARLPIEEVIGGYIKLEKAGKAYKARCPFHNEKSPSFFVSPDRGGYYCFGCNAKGDIFTFVEQFEGLDFKGALKVLAERAGVPLIMNEKTDNERDRLFKVMEAAAEYFEKQYENSSVAKAYILSRGISPETRAAFRLGWAPDGWRNLVTYLRGKGWSDEVMEKAGLVKKPEEGGQGTRDKELGTRNKVPSFAKATEGKQGTRESQTKSASNSSPYYDRFRGRIMFPITDSSGRVIAFTGRILKADDQSAKYLNSPETPIFSKSSVLFGLDKAKSEIRRQDHAILVEGQMDLVLSHQVGVKNVVAASGTALTDQAIGADGVVSNLGLLRRLSPYLKIALDADHAGRIAAMKAVAATAIGLGMSVKIAHIRGGKDPADLILANPEDWKNVLKNAEHVIEFELGNILSEVADPHKIPAALRTRIFPFLARMESEMDKAFYIKRISDKTGLAEAAVWEDMRKGARDKVQGTRESQSQSHTRSSSATSASGSPSPSSTHQLDLIERRMFGLLALMESATLPAAAQFRERIRTIAAERFEVTEAQVVPHIADLSFEAEAIFGNEPERLSRHMNELVLNYEENYINDKLVAAMHELRAAEKSGEQARVAELAQRCQELSKRKAEILKERK